MGIKAVRHALSPYRPDKVAYRGAVKGRLRAERWTLATRTRATGGQAPAMRGRILTYHSVGTPEWGVNDVSPRDFERHLQIAVDDGWSFTTPVEVIAEPDKPQEAANHGIHKPRKLRTTEERVRLQLWGSKRFVMH